MQEWDDDVDLDEWAEGSTRTDPSRVGLLVVAVLVLVPFIFLWAGGSNALGVLGPGLLAVIVFFGAVALAYLLVRRWLRRRLLDDAAGPGQSFWSDRR
ncbi:MAG TPA: hypothetical protein VK507_23725 [Iamia sp.]|nr:hypothetical protein [Iamia sp.]